MSPDLRELSVYAAALASEYERGRRDALEEAAKDPPPAKERERMLEDALTKIRRGPLLPPPDPIAHSWKAYATWAYNALGDARVIANAALAAPQEPAP